MGSGLGSCAQTAGKCHVVGDKVVGTIEGLHYKEEIWKAMSKEQKDKVVELHKAKSAGHAVKAATTTTAGTVLMDVLDQLQTLTRAVQSLDSGRDGGRQSMPRKFLPTLGMLPVQELKLLAWLPSVWGACWAL
jgi:hypothetical protein